MYSKALEMTWNTLYEPRSEASFKRTGIYKAISKYENGKRLPLQISNEVSPGTNMRDVWDMSIIAPTAKERLGYPTQKPVALYERMIKASSNQSDTVLDPFAGSGTTLDAAESLGRQWIGIDVGDAAINVIQGRLRDRHGLEYDRDYELIT